MSADNYIGIWWNKKNEMYYAFDLSASCDCPNKMPISSPIFIAADEREAIIKAQKEYTEYGFHFMTMKGEK